MTRVELKRILNECKASVLFEYEAAHTMQDLSKIGDLESLLNQVDTAIGGVDCLTETCPTKITGSVNNNLVDFDYSKYLYSKLSDL